ncbi:glutathione S-transferase T3-like [Eutrema salsugineum]|uniref:glutathione S-transferase T3-like n=1 Tax=Eutrema salsugineum TaxID=72664 RepID=UPI000CED3FD3|nr:glutathione S-transferase T3-like [Eutrema salsugineum]
MNKSGTFWRRIALYFAANQKGGEIRESGQCKQRWHKINDLVCKFCGAYEAATRERTSGQNENDIFKNAHAIFFNLHKKKFTLEYAWKELKNDQKWCDLSTSKTDGSCKRRKTEDANAEGNGDGNNTCSGNELL